MGRPRLNKELSPATLASYKWKAKNPDKVAKYNQYGEVKRKYQKGLTAEQRKDAKLKFHFGITLEDYNIMLFEQDGCCAICKTHHTELKRNLYVDHNHTTGEVRGLLCNNCNAGLGMYKDDITRLTNAINYLKK
jgi:hypothetical protein